MGNTDCLKIPQYEFWVESDGERLKQYETRETNEVGGSTMSCYIASKVGKEFRIGTIKHKGGHSTLIRYYLNDDCVSSHVLQDLEAWHFFIDHMSTENGQRRFAFSNIHYEEEELAEFTSVPKNLGTIRLEVFRVTNVREIPMKPHPYQPNTLNVSTLSEKAKTVSLHTISLLEPDAIKEERNNWCRYYDYIDRPGKTPWYTVKFLYRPLDILRAEGIVPTLPLNPAPSIRCRSGSTRDRKPSVATIKSEDSKVNIIPKLAGSEDPIIIEDSEEEDSKDLLKITLSRHEKIKTEKHLTSKRFRESSNLRDRRNKRVRKALDPVVITIDSD